MSSSVDCIECAICLDECLNPVRLDCGHIFCYLCVKGSAIQSSNRCPVCRQPIDENYFESPVLVDGIDDKDVPQMDGQIRWQYEGRNGWWAYDCRTSGYIESAFDTKLTKTEVLIAGFVYVIDFEHMIQFRRNDTNRIRKIRRQPLDPIATKGVAGIRTQVAVGQHLNNDSNISNQTQCSQRDSNSAQIGDQNEDNEELSGSDGQRVAVNGEDEDVLRLQQALDTNLRLSDTQRETYL